MDRLSRLRAHKDFPRDDITLFFVSYPKAGRTWVRYILSQLARAELGDSALASAILEEDTISTPRERLQFTHAFSQRDEFDAQDLEVVADHISARPFVFLHRDPRDVVVSYFYERTKRSLKSRYATPSDLNDFARLPDIGLKRIVHFYNIWADRFDRSTCRLIVSYEDLHASPVETANRVFAAIFGVAAATASVEAALRNATFARMKEIERASFYGPAGGQKRLRPYDVNDPNSYKVRKGRVGGYVSELDDTTRQFASDLLRSALHKAYAYQ